MINNNKCALLTITRDEKIFLPIWLNYYSKFFDQKNIYILDNQTIDGSTDNLKCNIDIIKNDICFDHKWMAEQVKLKICELLYDKKYEYILFAETDELFVANPEKYSGLDEFIVSSNEIMYRASSISITQLKEEPDLDVNNKILNQRKWQFNEPGYTKTLLTKIFIDWPLGYHTIPGEQPNINEDLTLFHLHRMDFKIAKEKALNNSRKNWNKPDYDNLWGKQNRICDENEFNDYFYNIQNIRAIPEKFIGIF
jgi:hypothetical protein